MLQSVPHPQPYQSVLTQFLADLDALCHDDPGVACGRARGVVVEAIKERLICANLQHELPGDFGMLTDEGDPCAQMNARVRRLVAGFIAEVEESREWQACATEGQREALLGSPSVRSPSGKCLEDFLGPWSEAC